MLGRFLCSPGRHGETCVNEVDKRCSSIVGQLDIDEERRDRSTDAQTLVVFLFEVLFTSFFLKIAWHQFNIMHQNGEKTSAIKSAFIPPLPLANTFNWQ